MFSMTRMQIHVTVLKKTKSNKCIKCLLFWSLKSKFPAADVDKMHVCLYHEHFVIHLFEEFHQCSIYKYLRVNNKCEAKRVGNKVAKTQIMTVEKFEIEIRTIHNWRRISFGLRGNEQNCNWLKTDRPTIIQDSLVVSCKFSFNFHFSWRMITSANPAFTFANHSTYIPTIG